jgi:predicted MFS family arabinose efflux permease
LGWLGFVQLLVVSAALAAAKIAFGAAGGAFLKAVVRPADLLVANARFESTTWSATAVGPPLGGAAIGLFGPVVTAVADACGYLLSALGIIAVRGREERPVRTPGRRGRELVAGWRHILAHRGLRALYVNVLLVNGSIMATEPLLAVLMLGQLGFAPWQFGLAFAVPCAGGLIGSRLARRVVGRYGRGTVLRVAGSLRAVWLIGLAFIPAGVGGLVLVMVLEFAIIVSVSLFNPVLATYRLEHTPDDRIARTLAAWSVSSSAAIAACTALAGVLASATSPRAAITVVGLVALASPLLLRPVVRPRGGGLPVGGVAVRSGPPRPGRPDR